jgi:hypothetical protein
VQVRPTGGWFTGCETAEQRKARLRELTLAWHPDRPTGDSDTMVSILTEFRSTAPAAWLDALDGLGLNSTLAGWDIIDPQSATAADFIFRDFAREWATDFEQMTAELDLLTSCSGSKICWMLDDDGRLPHETGYLGAVELPRPGAFEEALDAIAEGNCGAGNAYFLQFARVLLPGESDRPRVMAKIQACLAEAWRPRLVS